LSALKVVTGTKGNQDTDLFGSYLE
jgi:hypothetical protein